MRCPSRSAISLIFDLVSFLAPLRGAPEGAHSTTTFLRRIATAPAPLGISSSARPTARSVSPAAEKPDALDRAGGRDHRQPDRASVAGKGLRQCLDQPLIVASRRAHGNTQGGRPPQQKGRAGNRREDQERGGNQQKRRTSLPSCGSEVSVQTVRHRHVAAKLTNEPTEPPREASRLRSTGTLCPELRFGPLGRNGPVVAREPGCVGKRLRGHPVRAKG